MLLAEEPRNGYQIMQEVEERSGGLWRPSPGSVYPALQQLLDEGLIREQEIDGRRGYALTDEGKAVVDGRPADAPTPWETVGGAGAGEMHDLARLAREVAGAFAQLMRTGSPTQLERAKEVLATARRELYTILADGEQPKG
jgi:DNA-binding PadR family transcriptional regulator